MTRVFSWSGDGDWVQVLPGVSLKARAFGENTLLVEFSMEEGAKIPVHSHVEEQTGYLVSGRLRFEVGDDTVDAEGGDSWCFASGVPHGAEVLMDSTVVEVFSPPRKDYLPPSDR